jgi:hypothetical protein
MMDLLIRSRAGGFTSFRQENCRGLCKGAMTATG